MRRFIGVAMLTFIVLSIWVLIHLNTDKPIEESLFSVPTVKETQTHLKKWLYYNGDIDGIAGDKFKHGYEAYSHDKEIYDKKKGQKK